jgi:hypothetical protein
MLVVLREKLEPFYSEAGRPSIDAELMLRMLIVCLAVSSKGQVDLRSLRNGSFDAGEGFGQDVAGHCQLALLTSINCHRGNALFGRLRGYEALVSTST